MNIRLQCFSFIVYAAAGLCFTACHSGPQIPVESPTEGTIRISVDESFKPVIDSQLKVFESSFPNAHILVEYKPEAACLRDLSNDSIRMVIVTRGLSLAEERFYKDTAKTPAISGILAYDAVALVVSNHSPDTVLSMAQISEILQGTDKKKLEAVMDGVSATSTVRYMLDSVLRGKALGKNVIAARSSPQVIAYVAEHDKAVGFIGVNWIGDQEDSLSLAFKKQVKVVAVQCEQCTEKPYILPWQANIQLRRYPMVRGLYYILKENFSGVGNNFVNFLINERGQLIFKRSYLLPARMSLEIRTVELQEN